MQSFSSRIAFYWLSCLGLTAFTACQSNPDNAASTLPPATADTTATPIVAPAAATTTPQAGAVPDSVLLQPYVPAGYRILDIATGDLNRDIYPDKLVALDSVETDSASHGSFALRPLLLLTGSAQGRYTIAARNDHTVLCSGCGGMMGDPYQQMVIKNGYFSVEHYGGTGWRWTHIVTFKYRAVDQHWYLHREGGDSFHTSRPEEVETDAKTVQDFGRVRFEQYAGMSEE